VSLVGLYRLATGLATPLVRRYLRRRVQLGKEDPARLGERFGVAALPRPTGRLVWMHGASVGESLSLLPLIDRLIERDAGLGVLVTTGTLTSARLIATRLADRPRVWHQFLPVDAPSAVRRFLDHWRPDLALWVESELWPNLIIETRRRGTPMALINARLSSRSYENWRRWPGLIRPVLGSFDVVLAQDAVQAGRLRDLGAGGADTVGDLKAAAAPLPVDAAALAEARVALGDRPAWLAASTHSGEEAIVIEAHRLLAASHPGLLTVLAPRHPKRAASVAAELAAAGLTVARRSTGEPIERHTDILLVDTLGELGLYYRLAPIVLVGGSLHPPGTVGGHNPLEAAVLGCAILHGPDMLSCAATTAALDAAGAAVEVDDARSLAAAVEALLDDPDLATRRGEVAVAVAAAERGVIDRVLARLDPLLPPGIAGAAADTGTPRHALA